MKKTLSTLIDELTVTNIKMFHTKDAKKIKSLRSFQKELHRAIDGSKIMKKSLSSLIDELTVTNIKIFHLVDKILANKHTREDARKAQSLNSYRSKVCNAINREFKERETIKV